MSECGRSAASPSLTSPSIETGSATPSRDVQRNRTAKVGRPTRVMVEGEWRGQKYAGGYVITKHGVVGVYTQSDYTALTVVHNGLDYERFWQRDFTERALTARASKFAREIAAEPTSGAMPQEKG